MTKSLSESIGDFMPQLAQASWSDEEWARHDAEIEAERQRESDADIEAVANERRRQREWLDAWGLPDVGVEHFDRIVERRRLVACGVPVEVVEHVEMGSLEDWTSMRQTRGFESQLGRGRGKCVLVLEAKNETGKSTAAAWWVAQPGPSLPYLDGGKQEVYPARFLTASDFERMSKFSAKAIDRVYWARRLVLDDLGVEGKYEEMAKRLTALINHRVSQRLPLVITTNLPVSEWKDIFRGRHGGRVFSRLNRAATWWSANPEEEG